MRLVPLLLVAVSGAAACAGAPRAESGAPLPPLPPGALAGLPPFPPPCADSALHARAHARALAVVVPHPLRLFEPPLPVPAAVRGDSAVVEFRVDSVGRVDTAALVLRGPADRAYRERLRAYVLRLPFAPAEAADAGCSVEGWGSLSFTFGGSGP